MLQIHNNEYNKNFIANKSILLYDVKLAFTNLFLDYTKLNKENNK